MRFLPTEVSLLLAEPEMRRNLRALLKYIALLSATVAVFSVLFHVIMLLKGTPRFDSRNPHELRASITLRGEGRVSGKAAEYVTVPVRVENLGDIWVMDVVTDESE